MMLRQPGWLLVLALVAACSPKESEQTEGALATAFGEYLFFDNLPPDVQQQAKGSDSIAILRVFSNNWLRQQVALKKAKENLNEEIPDIEKKVADYRSSLLIYEYHKALFEQKLDTAVTFGEISAYYEKNQKNFELKRNIVRLRYVKIPVNAENKAKAKQWFLSEVPSDRFKLLDYCAQNAANTYLDEDAWLSFEDLLKEIPLNQYDQEHFLRSNKFVELQDKDFIYWLYIHSFRIKNSLSPLEIEQERIRSIIINKRKLQLLKEVEEALMIEAETNNQIKLYIE
jgi:hypothetical protein